MFQGRPALEGARTRRVDFSGSQMPGLLLCDARVDGLLRLAECRSDGALRLTRAHITGTADLTGMSVRGAPALHADSLLVERDIICRDAIVNGEMLMWSARVGGTLVLEGARITNPGGATLNGDGLVIAAGLFCGNALGRSGHALRSLGELRLQDAKISRCCLLSGAKLSRSSGAALNADRLQVEGLLALDAGFTADGPVTLTGATVHGPLVLKDATLNATGQRALDAALAHIGGDLASSGLTALGEVRLEGTRISGSADLAGARIHNPEGETLSARRLHVLGRLYCGNLVSQGHAVLTDASVAASAEFHGARLTNPAGNTLTARGLTVGGALDCCEGFLSHGRVSLSGSRTASALCLEGATIEGPLSVRRIRAGVVKTDARTQLHGPVDIRHSQIDVLADTPGCWPDDLRLDGLVYDHLDAPFPLHDRLAWLSKEIGGHLPQPYEQLAATYSRQGHDAAAREVLLAKCRAHRAGQPSAVRLWGHIQDWTVGYGYRPIRAAGWLVLLLLVATIAFDVRHPPAVKPSEAPPFNAFLYALDLLVPVVGFGQEQAFSPTGWQQWLAAALMASGWVLATTIATGLTRTLSRR